MFILVCLAGGTFRLLQIQCPRQGCNSGLSVDDTQVHPRDIGGPWWQEHAACSCLRRSIAGDPEGWNHMGSEERLFLSLGPSSNAFLSWSLTRSCTSCLEKPGVGRHFSGVWDTSALRPHMEEDLLSGNRPMSSLADGIQLDVEKSSTEGSNLTKQNQVKQHHLSVTKT